jgi:hypothetical protein
LYFHGDPNLKNDFARNAANERVITLASENDGLHKGVFDISLGGGWGTSWRIILWPA